MDHEHRNPRGIVRTVDQYAVTRDPLGSAHQPPPSGDSIICARKHVSIRGCEIRGERQLLTAKRHTLAQSGVAQPQAPGDVRGAVVPLELQHYGHRRGIRCTGQEPLNVELPETGADGNQWHAYAITRVPVAKALEPKLPGDEVLVEVACQESAGTVLDPNGIASFQTELLHRYSQWFAAVYEREEIPPDRRRV